MFGFIKDIMDSSGLSLDILNSGFRLINFSNKCIYFEGNVKIKFISSEEVIVKIKKGELKVIGDKLRIKNLSPDTLILLGNIKKMEAGE